jgi:hypothetical protein
MIHINAFSLEDVELQHRRLGILELPASQLPTVEGLERRAIWTAVSSRAWHASFEHRPRICQRSIEQVPCDTGQWNLQSTTPTRAFLSRVRTDVDVDKSLAPGALHDGTTEIWQSWSAGAETDGEIKAEVLACGSLHDRFVYYKRVDNWRRRLLV